MTLPELLTRAEVEGMIELSNTDPGMLDLLEKAKSYYVLKGSPRGPAIWAHKPSPEERRQTMMNTVYGLR